MMHAKSRKPLTSQNRNLAASAPLAGDVMADLQRIASPARAKVQMSFFKTGPGQYSEGDVFIGITVPNQREIARKHKAISISEISKLLHSTIHEHRLTGLMILVMQFQDAKRQNNRKAQQEIIECYLAHLGRVNNWDLVDGSAPYILGEWLVQQDKSGRDVLYKLAHSKSLWERRVAIVATQTFIRNNQFDDTIKLSHILIKDSHDLMHKAVGWMLREVGKKDVRVLNEFLEKNAWRMPRTALRYAIEHHSPNERKRFMRMQ